MQMHFVFTFLVNAIGMSHGLKACKEYPGALPALCDTCALKLYLESAAVSSVALGFMNLHYAKTLPAPPDPSEKEESLHLFQPVQR